jgi:ABC-type branched-subunit amino acid transport system ATPase component/ABC-type branched-subunit amino acid transport system permease subunit
MTMARLRLLAVGVCLVVLAVLPAFFPPYPKYVLILGLLNVIAAAGLALVMGYAGLVSLGHAGFVAIGAYATVLLTTSLGLPFWLALPAGSMLAGAVGFFIGLPALRLPPLYLATVTWGFGQSVWLVALNWVGLTNGQNGLKAPAPRILGYALTPEDMYWVVSAVTALALVAAHRITRARPGRALMAIRESEVAATAMGVDARAYKALAFTLSALLAGASGGLYVGVVRFINPDNFPFYASLLYVTMNVIGGMGSLAGAMIGALALTVLPELLRGFVEYRELLTGVALLGFLVFLPHGIVGLARSRGTAGGSPFLTTATAILPPARQRTGTISVPLLRVDGVTRRFGGVVALDNVGLEVRAGTIHGLIGPNGSGKTTLFNVITRLYAPDHGRIEFDGMNLLAVPAHDLAPLGIARTFQNLELFPRLSVRENVLIGMHRQLRVGVVGAALGLRAVRAIEAGGKRDAEALLEFVGIREGFDRRAGSLPFAQQRLLEIARALAARPRLLLLDEPSAGLTFGEVEELSGIIRRIRDDLGVTIVLVAHTMRLVFGLSDVVSVLDHGVTIATGRAEAVRSNPEVIRAYLGEEAAPANA